MCGIVGIWNRDGSPLDLGTMRAMRDAQRHRGPDDDGLALFSLRTQKWKEDDLGSPSAGFEGALGFNRLSILDLSKNGHQPMANADGTILLVFNGEIYNAFDHKPDLEARGHRFRSRTDTEVALYLYEEFGLEGMLKRISGMFAFGIVDLRQQRLVLIRDHLGVKPLYWFDDGNVVMFASETKAFLHHPAFRPALREEALAEYLQFRYCAGERTLLRGVEQVSPGSTISIAANGHRASRYWSVPRGPVDRGPSFEECVHEVATRLEQSTRSQLVSDVPVGCQLSGGLDSSLVTAMANGAANGRGRFEGFSIVVDDPAWSEEAWIDEVAHVTGVHCNKFRMGEAEFVDRLSPATWHLDQPLNHPNTVGIYYLAERSKPTVTVMLSGEGADEVFGGYQRFFRAQFFPMLHALATPLARIPSLRPRLRSLRGDQRTWFIKLSAYVDAAHAMEVSRRANPEEAFELRRSYWDRGTSFLRGALNYELSTYLVDLLIRQDKMTMAHSVENRVPFLDHTLVEYAATIPEKYLVSARPHVRDMEMRNLKRVLKRVAERYFSRDFLYRPKMGFGLPLARFLRSPRLRERIEDEVLPGAKSRGVLDASVMRKWWTNLDAPGNAEAFWVCFAFELWSRQFLDGRDVPCSG